MICDIELVTSRTRLLELRDDWMQLLLEAESTIFQTFEWISTWWEYHGARRDLYCFVFRQSSTIVGIAPFFRQALRFGILPRVRHLKIIGSPLSEYQHLIARRGCEDVVVDALCEYLCTHRREWDILDMESVNGESGGLGRLRSSMSKYNLRQYFYQGSVSAHVHLPSSFEQYKLGKDKRWRHELRRKWNGLCQKGNVQIEEFVEPGNSLRSAMTSFFEIHDARWKSLGYPNEFGNDQVRDFFVTLGERCAQRGWLRLSFLAVNGVRVAASLEFLYGRTVYVLHSQATGAEEIMKYSPGFLIKIKAIERAIAQNSTVYDLLRGEYAYKYRDFGAVPSRNWMIRARPPAGVADLRFALFLVHEFVSKISQRVAREHIESRRYRIAHGNAPFSVVRYTMSRIAALSRTGFDYLLRHTLGGDALLAEGRDTVAARPDGAGRRVEGKGYRHTLQEYCVGDRVRIKSEAAIRLTLDDRQMLQGLPFMPEMIQYCGREVRVSGWAHKTCIEGHGLRKLEDTLFLEDFRCNGSAHDGCQRTCLLFWKIGWLEECEEIHGVPVPPAHHPLPVKQERYTTRANDRYICQSTELHSATAPLPWWNLTQYVNDVRTRQLSVAAIRRGLAALLSGKARKLATGRSNAGLTGDQVKTPRQATHLQPGEFVRVKSREEIVSTLDSEGKNRGLEFAPEMTVLCGRTLRVQQRISTIILEMSGEARQLSDTVMLEGAFCDGIERRWCPRKNYFLWREIWLERIEEALSAPSQTVHRPHTLPAERQPQ